MSTKVTFGADPEFFVAKKENATKPVPACGLFGGGKKSPVFLTPEGGYLEDGCAVEFNVSPASTLVEVRKRLGRLITAFLTLNKDYVILPVASVQFDSKELRNHPQASVLGCDADFWAYGLRVKPQVNMFRNRRFAGGHIHIGLDPWPKNLEPKMFTKALDFFVYVPFACSHGCDTTRYEFYGHPGLYRETSYGIEWRSPDNYWAIPRASREMEDYWELAVKHMQENILTLITTVDNVGGEKFNSQFANFLDYTGLEPFFKNKNPSKLQALYSRMSEYKSHWHKTMLRH